jgi:translation elongation factor EF-G
MFMLVCVVLFLCSHLHHGKTSLMDLLVQLTHKKQWDPEKEYRYTDTRNDEQVLPTFNEF